MSDFNTPQKLSSGKWIYQGTEYSKNPLAKKATSKPKAKKKKDIDLDKVAKNERKRKDIFSGDIGGLARAIANL